MDSMLPFTVEHTLPLEQQVARLQALLEATRQIHSTINADEVMDRTARILVRELEMDGAVFLSPSGEVISKVWGDLPEAPYVGCRRFPLLSKDDQVLAEVVLSTPADGSFSLYEEDFVEGLILQTAVALENATLHERDLQWARVQQDLDAARAIQRSLLPGKMPQIANYSIYGQSTTCYEVGGDYLDTLTLPDGSELILVADVAGKGLASAIVATSFRAAFRALATQPMPLHELVGRIGQQHWEEGDEARRRYVTAIFVRLDLARGEVEVVNAGHNPGAFVLPDDSLRLLAASGPPLGMLPGMQYESEVISFPAGSRMLLYTDGLTEVFVGDEEFGEERLMEEFREHGSRQSSEILDTLWKTLDAFSHGAPQTDDMTAVAICHLDSSSREHPAT
jgi:sigma-B regulation protein RsbU (phosphoserine phosphatase)